MNDRILNNKKIIVADKRGEEMVSEMFDILVTHEDLIPKNKDNEWKTKTFGIERTIIDLIQWLGDNNFEHVLKNYKKKIS